MGPCRVMAAIIPFVAAVFAVFLAYARHDALDLFLRRSLIVEDTPSSSLRNLDSSGSQKPSNAVGHSATLDANEIDEIEGDGKFRGFMPLCRRAGLQCNPIEEVEKFQVDLHYKRKGGDEAKPVVVRGAARTVRAVERWKERDYLRSIFDKYSPDMESVVTTKIFIRGTDAFMGQDAQVSVESGTDWLFGDRAKTEKGAE